ncbi:MAG: alpha-amylase [Rhodoferax sp.]|nr:alpha-amylase [Rhodoferax sp.]
MMRLHACTHGLRTLLIWAVCVLGAGVSAQPLPVSAADVAAVAPADPGSTLPADWQHGVFMEIYVRGYQDSDGDGVGDLRGLTARLDYLQKLGVSGLWLMPIFKSQDQDHGYAVVDYRAIEPEYGTLADFDEFLKQAHARGIGVILDYTLNHSGADHPLFEAARSKRTGPYRDWYVWADPAPAGWNIYGKNPWYPDDFGAYFAGFSDQMPEFNLRNPRVVEWHHDNLRFWLNRGVDGFRFDAVGNLVENGALAWEGQEESHQLMADVQALLKTYANRYMVCEAPGDAVGFGAATSCGSSFAFGHNNRIVSAALGNPSAIEQIASYFSKAPAGMAQFASNHDAFAGQRLMDRMQGDAPRYRLAAASYLLQPGTPFVYYGEEIGMAGGAGLGGDHKLRTPMSWSSSAPHAGFSTVDPFRKLSANLASHNVEREDSAPDSLLNFYRGLIGLRNQHVSLRSGSYQAVRVEGWTLSFQRVAVDEHSLVLINYADKPARVPTKDLPAGSRLQQIWPPAQAGSTVVLDKTGSLPLPPLSVAVFTKSTTP